MSNAQLTAREKEVLALIAVGHDAKSAARELNISPNTIHERLRRAREKIGTTSSREAARMFFNDEPHAPENLIPEKLVLADILSSTPFADLLEPRATANDFGAQSDERVTYQASSFQFSTQSFLPLRKQGERDFRATTSERLRMIGELTAKMAFAFVAICLSAMLLSNIIRRG
jgi:DNA-binding CsgD family transcriptional regulator